jgi:hypothetical protein
VTVLSIKDLQPQKYYYVVLNGKKFLKTGAELKTEMIGNNTLKIKIDVERPL